MSEIDKCINTDVHRPKSSLMHYQLLLQHLQFNYQPGLLRRLSTLLDNC